MPSIIRRLRGPLLVFVEALLLAGCATTGYGDRVGSKPFAPIADASEAVPTLKRLGQEMKAHPDDVSLREQYYMQREQERSAWLLQAQQALRENRLLQARRDLKRVLAIDPNNALALQLADRLGKAEEHQRMLDQARSDIGAGRFEAAQRSLRSLLRQNARNAAALALLQRARDGARKQDLLHALDPKFDKETVSLEFQGAPLRAVFYALSQQSGLNFSFDPGVPLNSNVTLFARNTPVVNVLDMLLSTQHLHQRVLNGDTLGISPEHPLQLPPAAGGVQMHAFYLTNAQPKLVQQLLEGLGSLHEVYTDETLDLVMVKGTPQQIDTARRLIEMVDKAPAEVMLDVEVLEVQQDLLRNLGVEYPNQFGLLNVQPAATSVTTPTGTTITSPSATSLTVQSLRSINASQITINQLLVNLRDNKGNVKLLANPRIRVKNDVQAQIKIGEKVPVFNSNTTPTGVISTSVSYLDVGLDLKVQPKVMLDSDVQIQIKLDVSSILNQVTGSNGQVGYQIGTRDANTTLRLADGQTQMLAGLISDSEQRTFDGLPGLGELPVIGRLFSNHQNDDSKTEIVLLITPHVLRALDATPVGAAKPVAEDDDGLGPLATRYAISGSLPQSSGSTGPSPLPAPALPAVAARLPAGFIPPGTRLPPGFLAKPVPTPSQPAAR